MNVLNKSKRLICMNVAGKRIELFPGTPVDASELDALKGKDKVFDHYLKVGDIVEVKAGTKSDDNADKEPTKKEALQARLIELGGEPGDMTIADLESAIEEASK